MQRTPKQRPQNAKFWENTYDSHLVKDGIQNMLIETPVLQNSKNPASPATSIGPTNHVSREVFSQVSDRPGQERCKIYQEQVKKASC